jgi:hypothetical protein
MVQSMKPGSVIVDMAAEQGGNCELTVPGEAVVRHGVTIIGYTDLASRLAKQSSTLYATNLLRLTEELCKAKDGVAVVNMEDDAIRGLTVVKDGEITWPAPPSPRRRPAPKPAAAPVERRKRPWPWRRRAHAGQDAGHRFCRGRLALVVGAYAPAAFLGHFTVFVLACFIGYMVVWNVTPALHTPLMSVTNAISSIIAIGALVQIAPPDAAGNRRPDGLILGWPCRAGAHGHQHVRRLCSHAPHAGHVPQVRRTRTREKQHVPKSRYRRLPGRGHFVHPQPRWPVQPRNLTPRQSVRHGRHGAGRAGHRVRPRVEPAASPGSSARWSSAAASACMRPRSSR